MAPRAGAAEGNEELADLPVGGGGVVPREVPARQADDEHVLGREALRALEGGATSMTVLENILLARRRSRSCAFCSTKERSIDMPRRIVKCCIASCRAIAPVLWIRGGDWDP
jgi:hypothetical protein